MQFGASTQCPLNQGFYLKKIIGFRGNDLIPLSGVENCRTLNFENYHEWLSIIISVGPKLKIPKKLRLLYFGIANFEQFRFQSI